MRQRFALLIAGLVILAIAPMRLLAAQKLEIADVQHLRLYSATKVGESLLPAGVYEVRHVLNGNSHVMVFSQIDSSPAIVPASATAQCQLVRLPAKSKQTLLFRSINSSNELVLGELVFKGENARHIF
jgi:hypothetical protein